MRLASAEPVAAPLVLVVEADPALRRSLSVRLTDRAFRVEQATTLPEALEAIDHQQPSIVLLDLDLPDLDARDLMGALHARGPRVQVILMGADQQTLAARATSLGVVAYVVKPFEFLSVLGG